MSVPALRNPAAVLLYRQYCIPKAAAAPQCSRALVRQNSVQLGGCVPDQERAQFAAKQAHCLRARLAVQ
ncbi:MAG: hypothetical protein ACYC7H_13430, partial [Chloroflexota bacterium]